ncbi:hypothetical protein CORC01_14220 [Colletotrichum orchidophilum]|uniref:Uncharacterized protein n=1 Tax=Colletotrichum orchidophilum TaxID=1209926 RepID=A0A1G4AMS5_9PEZI|nr:uncharacterized protein CORC01_14220 [Colletotrichum orchidophilum]OHE90479.1 hypothetical protein CORC01_14220 [Colletotrichum orchidophilum]
MQQQVGEKRRGVRGVRGVSSSQHPPRPPGIRGLGTPYLNVGDQVPHTPTGAGEGLPSPGATTRDKVGRYLRHPATPSA